MRLDSVEGITVTSVGGCVANLGSRPSGGNSFSYMAPGPSSIGGILTITLNKKARLMETKRQIFLTDNIQFGFIKVFCQC